MSVEPPPPDWVRSDAAFHHRRSILDGENRGPTRSNSRVVLESSRRAAILEQPEPPQAAGGGSLRKVGGGPTPPFEDGFVGALRRAWEDVAFTTLRRTQLLTFLVLVVVTTMALYGWQQGTLPGMARQMAGERIVTDTAPAAPRLRSDQVAWGDGDDESRRSTASFASDRAFAVGDDGGEPTSGAKLFVADGKKSSKGAASGLTGNEANDATAGDASRSAESGAGSGGAPDTGASTRKQPPVTTSVVRYESCAEAAAAGAAPIELGEPGYRLSLDADRDGVACENGSAAEAPGDGPVDSLYSNPTTTASGRDSGSTTVASSTGAGTTSTVESTTTSKSSTTEAATTSTVGPASSRVTSTTAASTTSTTSTTETPTSPVSTATTTSTTSTTSTTASSPTTTTSTTTTTPSTTTTASSPTTTASSTTSASAGGDGRSPDPGRFGRPT